MATHATITLHPVWGCRWSAQAAQGSWVCNVDGHQRFIDENECATCLFWEQAAEHSHRGAVVPPNTLEIAVRAVLVLAAILFVATGVVGPDWTLDGPVHDRTLARSSGTGWPGDVCSTIGGLNCSGGN